jgi:hypothetical protein
VLVPGRSDSREFANLGNETRVYREKGHVPPRLHLNEHDVLHHEPQHQQPVNHTGASPADTTPQQNGRDAEQSRPPKVLYPTAGRTFREVDDPVDEGDHRERREDGDSGPSPSSSSRLLQPTWQRHPLRGHFETGPAERPLPVALGLRRLVVCAIRPVGEAQG